MSSANVMGSFIAQVLSLSSLLAFLFGFFIKSRFVVNILCIISSIIEVSFIASINTFGVGGHVYIFSIIISLIIGNLVFASRKSSTKSTKKSKRSQNIKVESFVSVSFSSIENFAVNNSKNENALVALLIYFVANKKLDKKLIDYPMQYNEKMKFDLCDLLFKEFNTITDELIKIKEDCLEKDEKEKILEFKYALDEALMFIYGFLTMKKQLEINLIIRSWKILCNDKQYIQSELEIKKLPSFFDEMIDSFDDIKDKTNQFDPYFISDQYEIDLKKQKKEDFQKLKNNALDGVANTLEGIGSLVKKTRSSKTTNNNIGLEEKLNKLNELKNNKTITESEYKESRVRLLEKFTDSDSNENLSNNHEDKKEDFKKEDSINLNVNNSEDFESRSYEENFLDQAAGILKDQLQIAEKNYLQKKYKSKEDYKKFLINEYSFGCIHGVAYALVDKGEETGLFNRELAYMLALMTVSVNVLDDYFDKELIAELSNDFNVNTEENSDLDFKKYHEIVHIARSEVRNAFKNKTPITTWYNYLLSI